MGANLTVPIPVRDFPKLKILECITVDQQMNWIEPCVLTTFETLFFFFVSYWGQCVQNNGPEMVVRFGIKHIKFNVKYS